MTRRAIGILLTMLAVGYSEAQDINWIFQHNDNLVEGPHENYEIFQEAQTVTIHQGESGETFLLEARIGHWEGETWIDAGEGDIHLIQADQNAGEVAIRVWPHFGEEYGARDIREIRLGADDVNSTILKLQISGNLGDPEKDPIVADVIAGTFRVQGDIVHDIAIEWLTGDICCASLENLWVITPTIPIPGGHTGNVTVSGAYDATMSFQDLMAGTITIGGEMSGTIEGTDDMGSITVGGDLSGDIHVGRDLSGGHIIVNGSFRAGAEIRIDRQFGGDSEFIAIDYDGWDELDYWYIGAIVWVDEDPYYGNRPEMCIWHITRCKGDMNNDGEVDEDDLTAQWHAIYQPAFYAILFPGLVGSMVWHADQDCDLVLDEVDESALAFFAQDPPCCLYDAECTEYEACRADLDRGGEVGLGDLSILLATYDLCEDDPDFNPDADFDNDGCVYLNDLSFLLAVYGQTCSCFGGGEDGGEEGGGGDGSGGADVGVAMDAYDTNGFEGDGFAGERDHFVFDLMTEVLDDADDWTASGVAVQAENGAIFRLAAEPTVVDPLASFVCAPQGGDADEPDAGTFVAGAFSPVDSLYDFEPELINLCWFDRVDSLDGPAAIMRLVIDVSGVSGADTADGFGSVYFSHDGPHDAADIKVADFISATGSRFDAEGFTVLAGEFFVTGG